MCYVLSGYCSCMWRGEVCSTTLQNLLRSGIGMTVIVLPSHWLVFRSCYVVVVIVVVVGVADVALYRRGSVLAEEHL